MSAKSFRIIKNNANLDKKTQVLQNTHGHLTCKQTFCVRQIQDYLVGSFFSFCAF